MKKLLLAAAAVAVLVADPIAYSWAADAHHPGKGTTTPASGEMPMMGDAAGMGPMMSMMHAMMSGGDGTGMAVMGDGEMMARCQQMMAQMTSMHGDGGKPPKPQG